MLSDSLRRMIDGTANQAELYSLIDRLRELDVFIHKGHGDQGGGSQHLVTTGSYAGFAPALSGSSTQFLNGAGAYATPPTASSGCAGYMPALNGSSGSVLNGSGGWIDHGGLNGRSDDDHTQYALLAGRTGGQTIVGLTNINGTLRATGQANPTTGCGMEFLYNGANAFMLGYNRTAGAYLPVFIDGSLLYLNYNGGNVGVGGTPNAKFEVVGTTRLGNGASYTSTEADGTLVFVGSATVYEDLRINMSNVKAPAADAPTWTAYKGSEVPAFSKSATNTLYFAAQLPHSYKQGSNIEFHIHVAYPDNGAGNSVWQFTYTWANIAAAFPAATTGSVAIASPTTTDQHALAELVASMDGTGKNISSCLLCSISRLGGHTSDTYDNVIYLIMGDFHFEIDTVGSRAPTSK